jgi:hypothetical protein
MSITVMPTSEKTVRRYGRRGRRGRRGRVAVDQVAAGRFASAMYEVRELGAELQAARASGAGIQERRRLHAQVDRELVRAIEAAKSIYEELVRSAGNHYRATADPQARHWKRQLNTALTVRSQHQLAEFADPGVVAPHVVKPPSRAAFGPRQPGLDFDVGEATHR